MPDRTVPGFVNVRQAVMAARLEVDLAREAAHAGDAAKAAGWADKAWEDLTAALPGLTAMTDALGVRNGEVADSAA